MAATPAECGSLLSASCGFGGAYGIGGLWLEVDGGRGRFTSEPASRSMRNPCALPGGLEGWECFGFFAGDMGAEVAEEG
jgi:hypothetical protein